jgi:hypothetical protein
LLLLWTVLLVLLSLLLRGGVDTSFILPNNVPRELRNSIVMSATVIVSAGWGSSF